MNLHDTILHLIKNDKEARKAISKAAMPIIDKIYSYYSSTDTKDDKSSDIKQWVDNNLKTCEEIVEKYYVVEKKQENNTRQPVVEETLPPTMNLSVETPTSVDTKKNDSNLNYGEETYNITLEQHVWLTAWTAAIQSGKSDPHSIAEKCLNDFIKKFKIK